MRELQKVTSTINFIPVIEKYWKIRPRFIRITYQYSSKDFRQLLENLPVDFDMGCALLYTCWHSSELQWPARRSISGEKSVYIILL